MDSEAFLGPKNHLEVVAIVFACNRTRFTITHMEIGVHVYQEHPWNRAKNRHTKASQYFVTLDLILSNARQECVATALTICRSPEFSFMLGLRSSCGQKSVGDMCFSPTSEGSATSSQSKHWSGDCRVRQTCSASPVREIKETVPLKLSEVQSSKFKFQKLVL